MSHLAVLVVLVVHALVGTAILLSLVHTRHAAAREREAERRAETTRIVDLPMETSTPVRIRGRFRVATDDDEVVHAWVEDGDQIAIFPISGDLSATDAKTGAAVDTVAVDQVIEVVGIGRRVVTSSEGYRDVSHTFSFDGAHPVAILRV